MIILPNNESKIVNNEQLHFEMNRDSELLNTQNVAIHNIEAILDAYDNNKISEEGVLYLTGMGPDELSDHLTITNEGLLKKLLSVRFTKKIYMAIADVHSYLAKRLNPLNHKQADENSKDSTHLQQALRETASIGKGATWGDGLDGAMEFMSNLKDVADGDVKDVARNKVKIQNFTEKISSANTHEIPISSKHITTDKNFRDYIKKCTTAIKNLESVFKDIDKGIQDSDKLKSAACKSLGRELYHLVHTFVSMIKTSTHYRVTLVKYLSKQKMRDPSFYG